MNPNEIKIFSGLGCWDICDALLIACILLPHRIVKRIVKYHATVELHGTHTRGQVALDHMRKNSPNINMIEAIDVDACKEVFLWAVGQFDIDFKT